MVLLPPPPDQEPVPDHLGWGNPEQSHGLAFRYGVVRVWELDPGMGFQHPGLLPLVPLMRQVEVTPALLDACVAQVDAWAPATIERQNLLWCVGNLASLRYDRDVIRAWLRRLGMTETPLMQWLREEGEAKGEAKGKAEGKAEGEAQALLTILQTRGLGISDLQQARILGCKDLAQLEAWLKRSLTAASTEDVLA